VNRLALSIRDAIVNGTRLAAKGACGKGARAVIVLRHGIGSLHFSNKRKFLNPRGQMLTMWPSFDPKQLTASPCASRAKIQTVRMCGIG
jgi:hypothetical protein